MRRRAGQRTLTCAARAARHEVRRPLDFVDDEADDAGSDADGEEEGGGGGGARGKGSEATPEAHRQPFGALFRRTGWC